MNGNKLRTQREQLGLSQAKLSELAEVPQHLLSSFELGKSGLAERYRRKLDEVLNDSEALLRLVSRKKRYRKHDYAAARHDACRAARCLPTQENSVYRRALKTLHREHLSRKQHAPRALSVFSGCGGFSLGFSAAGYSDGGYLEIDPSLSEIYRLNFPGACKLGDDIRSLRPAIIDRRIASIGPIDVLIGGPPCQGFSLSGKRAVDDPRNVLFRHYLRVLDRAKPAVAVIENVRLLTSMKAPDGTRVKDNILEAFRSRGYRASFFEINAKNYGVPQHRERVFFIAVRDDLNREPSMPAPTHGLEGDLLGDSRPLRTFADACSDLAYLESGECADDLHATVSHPAHVIDWLWNVPEAASAHDNADPTNRPPSGYNTTYKRQVWNKPAATIQTTFGMISGCRNVHPIATRALTIREAARIQSFPDDFQFAGNLGTIRTGIGNAVPPLLARALARHIKIKFLKFGRGTQAPD